MKIYIDLVILLNFFFDFLLLFSINILLKRNIKIKRLILGSLVGALSILFLFIPLNTITLFFLKIIMSIMMILVTFNYKDFNYFLKNIIYLYLLSIILGGSLYLLNITFSYKNKGIIFFHNGLSINIILIIIISPLIIYYYIKESKKYKSNINNYYLVEIFYKNKKYTLRGFLDTGNNLTDPYKRRGIILLNRNIIKFKQTKIIYVPFEALNNSGVVKCTSPDKVTINKHVFTNLLIGESNNIFKINGVDCILPNKIKEEL